MRYSIADIETQLIATLLENDDYGTESLQAEVVAAAGTELAGVVIRTHEGEINQATIGSSQLMDGIIKRVPFIFVQYLGRIGEPRDAAKTKYIHTLHFRIYVGARSLRLKREAQLTCYSMLASVLISCTATGRKQV